MLELYSKNNSITLNCWYTALICLWTNNCIIIVKNTNEPKGKFIHCLRLTCPLFTYLLTLSIFLKNSILNLEYSFYLFIVTYSPTLRKIRPQVLAFLEIAIDFNTISQNRWWLSWIINTFRLSFVQCKTF